MFETIQFSHLVQIQPLGFLYGSAGRFLSPENLVGRSGQQFPPTAATLSGLFSTQLARDHLATLALAGPFWAKSLHLKKNDQNFYIPTPFTHLVDPNLTIKHTLTYHSQQGWTTVTGKYKSGTWCPIKDWPNLRHPQTDPWQFTPHLHPRLDPNQRKVAIDASAQQGSLFLENAVELDPDVSLVYLTNHPIPNGWYRFGGEGHMVDLTCHDLDPKIKDLLTQPLGSSFALITPALWGSNRLSYREPVVNGDPVWSTETLLTERPHTYRYRLGGAGRTKRLSRGRYAVPSGTVYVLKDSLPPWQDWDPAWFPTEAYSFKRWGCGLALPLPNVLSNPTAQSPAQSA